VSGTAEPSRLTVGAVFLSAGRFELLFSCRRTAGASDAARSDVLPEPPAMCIVTLIVQA